MNPLLTPEVLWLPGAMRHEIWATGEDTAGAFCLFVDHPPPKWRLPGHRHLAETEVIHILEGRFDMEIEGEHHELGPGEAIQVPVGAAHSGGNIGSETGKRVVIFSPAGPEHFFREIGTDDPRQEVKLAEILEAAGRHGFALVGSEEP